MSQNQPNESSNTLIDLILALKGLAQTFDLAHMNLRSLIESESKAAMRELGHIRDILSKNTEALAILPISVADRVDTLLNKVERDLNEKSEAVLKEVTNSIAQVQEKFVQYIKATGEKVPENLLEKSAKVEVRNDGSVSVYLQTEWVQKAIVAAKLLIFSGGSYSAIEFIRYLLNI